MANPSAQPPPIPATVTQPDRKPCPVCAEFIMKAATKCRFCGADLAATHARPAATTQAKTSSRAVRMFKRAALGFVGLFILFGIIGALSNNRNESRSSVKVVSEPSDYSNEAPVHYVTASEILAEYQANEVAADAKFKGTWISLRGEVKSIDKDFLGQMVIVMKAGRRFDTVHATARKSQVEEVSALHKDTWATLICKGGGMVMGSPMLNNCRVL